MPLAVALFNYWTIREAVPLSRIFYQTGIFRAVFSMQYNINIAGGSSEAAMSGVGGAQCPVLRVNEL